VTGDNPDPTILRTGGGWYASSSSGDWLPAFPILHSADLVHWRQVGSVLPRRPSWARDDFWAPALDRRRSRVLAYYSARARDGRRCIAVATGPGVRGPYRDNGPLLCSRIGEIDPLPVRDEQGARWLVWKRDGNSRGRPTPILAAPLAPGGASLAAPPRELFRASLPWERRNVEAPALVRHRGLLYLVYSAGHCCGRNCIYATGVARSVSLLGPWEKRRRPILRGGGGLRCPGHVGIATDASGDPVLAYHAYVHGDLSDRRLLTARLGFDVAGWPVVERPAAPPARPARASFGFARPLGLGWSWPAGPRPAGRVAAGRLVLGRGELARQTGTVRFTAQAVVRRGGPHTRPGLAVVSQGGNAVGVELRDGRAVAWRMDDGRRRDLQAVRVRPRSTRLRIVVGFRVRLVVRVNHGWRRVGRAQPLPRWGGGAHAALTMNGTPRSRAQFDSLEIEPR